jgi:hypothetical protein
MGKLIRYIVIAVGVLVFGYFTLLFIAFAMYNMSLDDQYDWFTATNADQSIKIDVKHNEPPPLGQHDVFVYVNDELLIETDIGNDSRILRENNYRLTWTPDGAVLSFDGKEQQEESFHIFIDQGKISYRLIKDKHDR